MDNNNNNLFDMYNSGGTREDTNNETNQIDQDMTSRNLPVEEPLIDTSNVENNEADASIEQSVTQVVPLPVERPIIENTEVSDNNEENTVESPDTKAVPDSVMNSLNAEDEKITEDKLLEVYVGDNYESIAKGGFSFATFFLGAWYLFYRKQYKYSFILLGLGLVGMICLFAIPFLYVIILVISFVLGIYFSITFKKKYMETARKKTNEIYNMNISGSDKKKMARSVGGVDNKVLLVFILYILLSGMISASILLDYKPKAAIKDEIEFKVPDWAESNIKDRNTDASIRDKYQYIDKIFTYKDKKNECIVRLSSNNEYVDVDESPRTREYMENVLNKEFAFTEETHNKIHLSYYYDNQYDNYYYLYSSDKIMQLFKITIKKDESLKCTKLKEDMVKSVSLVK